MLDPDAELAKGLESGMSVEVELAHVTVSNIQECLLVIIPSFSECGEGAIDICNEGGYLLDLIEIAQQGLGKVDVSTIKNRQLEDVLSEFIDKACSFDENNNESKLKGILKMLKKNSETFCSSLKRAWNTDNHNQSEEVVVESGSWGFVKCSPLKGSVIHECPKCSKKLTNASHFERHVKDCNGSGGSGLNADSEFKVQHPRVTCRLPHKSGKHTSVRWDQFGRHLKTVHGKPRPDDHYPRGFLTKDGGKTYEIVFLKKGDPDPEPPKRPESGDNENMEDRNDGDSQPEMNVSQPQEVSKEEQSQHQTNASQPQEVSYDGQVLQNVSQSQDSNANDKVQTIVVEQTESIKRLISCGLVDEELDHAADEFSRQVIMKRKIPITLSPEFHGFDSVPKRKIIVSPESPESSPYPYKYHEKRIESEPEKPPIPSDSESPGVIDLEDEFCRSFEEHQEALKVQYEKFNFTVDSDIEDNDSDPFTKTRIENKKQRFAERNVSRPSFNLSQLPGNSEVLEEMLSIISAESSSTNQSNAVLTDTRNLLFAHKDSFLHFMVARVPDFQMKYLIDFNGDKFVPLPNPSDWVNAIGGSSGKEEAGRRKSMLKTYKRLINYVDKKIGKVDWPTDTMSLVRRNQLIVDLERLSKEIDNSKMMSQLNTLAENDRMERRLAKEILNPNQSFNETNGNKVYFASQKFLARQEKNEQIFKKAMKTNKITDSEFTEVSSFARSILAFTDRNRSAAFNFSNADYLNKTPLWFPVDHNRSQFDGIPSDSIKDPPADGRPPDLHMIQLSGKTAGLKLQRPVTVTIIPLVDGWMRKLRMLKDLHFGSSLVLTDPFFQSAGGKALGQMTNTRGSMLQEYGEVTGIDFVTQNIIRRSLETHVQSNSQLKARNLGVVNHSVAVSQQYYDSSDAIFRSTALHYVNQQEMPQPQSQDDDEIDTEVSAKRARLEKEDEEVRIKNAQSLLKKTVNKNVSVGPRCKLTPENRLWIQKTFSKGGIFEAELKNYQKFPGPKKWRAVFYRKLDSMQSGDKERKKLLEIEMETFKAIKSKACVGEWDGTLASNKKADELVAAAIHGSLKTYENNRKDYDETFFIM